MPIAEKQRKFVEEAVVGVAEHLDGGWAGVAIDTAIKTLDCRDQFLPRLVIVFVGDLMVKLARWTFQRVGATHTTFARSSLIFGAASSSPLYVTSAMLPRPYTILAGIDDLVLGEREIGIGVEVVAKPW